MTDREMKVAKATLPKWENGILPVLNAEQMQLDGELWCREMINSILIYRGVEALNGNPYLDKYIQELGQECVDRLCDEQVKDFKKAVVRENVHIDNEGVSYNSIIWADDILDEIVKLAKDELNKEGSIGYTLPDGKHHIYIYTESFDMDGSYHYIVEPNRIDKDGCCEPLGDTMAVKENDFEDLRKACDWCMDEFVLDREQGKVVSEVIAGAKVKSEETVATQANKENDITM